MYGNNFGYPFMGGMSTPPISGNMFNPMMQTPTRGIGSGLRSLFGLGRTSGGISSSGSGFSFANLLNGASKTLGVVKDAIPVVKEVGPMMNNMRSMLKIASVFKDETDTSQKKEVNTSNSSSNMNNNTNTNSQSIQYVNQVNNKPNFFL